MNRQEEPILLLQFIERRSKEYAQGLPQRIEIRSTWDGVGFRLGQLRLVASLGEVREILHCPRLTKVPGAKRWIEGVANVRGTLLPIMDLHDYLTGVDTEVGRRTRVLVVRRNGMMVGLLVDEVSGMRHFFEEERTDELPDAGEAVRRCLGGAYQQAGDLWAVFDLQTLLDDPGFLLVAA